MWIADDQFKEIQVALKFYMTTIPGKKHEHKFVTHFLERALVIADGATKDANPPPKKRYSKGTRNPFTGEKITFG